MGKEKFLLILVLILGLILRLVKLDQGFWLDEASQAQQSSLSLTQIWSGRAGDFHPPLFYVLAHFWLQFGRSETWLRLLPVSFGILNIIALYFFAKHIHPRLGLPAAFLLAINPFHIYYSQEFRMYSLLTFLGTLSMPAFYKKHWSLFLLNALLLYTHYAGIILILAQFVYVIVFDRKYLRTSTFHFLLSVALFLPWLPQFFAQFQSGTGIDTYLPGWRNLLTLSPLKAIPLILFKFVAGRIDLLPRWIYAVYIVFVLAVTAAGVVLARGKRRLLYTWLGVPIVASLVISFVIPQTQPFRLIFTLPALVLLLAEAVLRWPRTFLTLLIYIAIVGNYTYFTRPRLQREQWRQALEFIRIQPAPMVVKFPGAFAPMTWYAPDLPVITASSFPTAKLSDFYLFQYLTGLTDPQYKIDSQIQASGYTLQKRYNFEGVGFIDYYHK
ncbi:MAG: Glycosyl transferase family 39 [Candidatus Amesbacteria bacterium GW2011_GWA2_47_11b]|uniref:Glycosyl transferase family 39 n=2 Tax=Candidatus Amesiibacteriota TaxID=1752730 RepID=A0A0G1TWL0_9BACT|nr:MAG: Glycosyl transferase family 39 [Candidatus Amesbacteria bacterium GW2011_GWA2_47_11b]